MAGPQGQVDQYPSSLRSARREARQQPLSQRTRGGRL